MDYFAIYQDIWKFHKKYINDTRNDDDFWKSLVEDGEKISSKYSQCKFVIALVLAEMEEIERLHGITKQTGQY